MSRLLRSRTICVRFLMFAMAIQALTLGAFNPNSSALFNLLDISADCNLAAGRGEVPASDPTPDSGDSLPSGSNEWDELPNEIYLPGGCPTRLIVHRGQSGSKRPVSLLFHLSKPSGQYHGRDIIVCHARHISSTSPRLSHVHLTC